jgi:hypothetical protein
MVTSGNGLSALDEHLRVEKWDLVDMAKADAWYMKTVAALGSKPEVLFALTNGPVTAEMVMARSPTKMSSKRAAAVAAGLASDYKTANAEAFRGVLKRLSFDKKPNLPGQLLRKIAPEEDGYALWQIVLAARDMSSNEKQLELERQYREYKLSKAMPTPEELEDELLGLLVLWLKIDGNKEDKFSPLINRSLRLLPAGPQVAAEMTSFVGTVRALVGLNVGYKVWAKFEDFVTMIIGQYTAR